MLEINGLIDFDKGLYHNQHYENHIKNIAETRESYRWDSSNFASYLKSDAKNIASRKEIAAGELKSWRDYVETRKRELPEVSSNRKIILMKGILDHWQDEGKIPTSLGNH